MFDPRARAWGMHLDVPRGRFGALAPRRDAGPCGSWRYGRRRVVRGFNRLTDGPATPERLAEGLARVRVAGYGHRDDRSRRRSLVAGELSPARSTRALRPTTGDRVRLGDTDLLARIERDESSYGDEVLRGWAKTPRTGIMTSAELPAASELDLIVTNVIVIDPVLGVFKANIGVKDGMIVGVGRAGNPDVVDNPDLPHRLQHRAGLRPGLHRHARRHRHPRPPGHAAPRSRLRWPPA